MQLSIATWAWVLVALGALELVLLGSAAAALVRRHLRRQRPLMRLADALERGDVDKARFLLAAIPGAPGRRLAGFCQASVESGPPERARARFLRGLLVAFPIAPLGAKLWIGAVCGAAALLPYLVGVAGRADALAAAAIAGAPVDPLALALYRLGFAETVAASAVTWALLLVAHRVDPGAPAVRGRLVRTLAPRRPGRHDA